MTQVFSWIAVLGLLSVLGAPAAPSFAPDEQHNGPTLNGSPLQPLDPKIRGFAVEGVELPDGTVLDR